jgi:uncharacterized protein YggE
MTSKHRVKHSCWSGVLILVLASPLSAWANAGRRSVAVTGDCVRSVIPDRGAVILTAEAKSPDSKRTQTEAKKLYEGVRSKVAALRLPDGEISTSEYVSEEVREWNNGKQVSRGFRTRIGLRVETSDHSRLCEVLEIGSRGGITEMSGLMLFVSPKKMLEEKMVCLKEAAEQARSKADSLAKTLGAKLGEVLSIEEDSVVRSRPEPGLALRMERMDMMKSVAASAPVIEPGKTQLNTSVQVWFSLK